MLSHARQAATILSSSRGGPAINKGCRTGFSSVSAMGGKRTLPTDAYELGCRMRRLCNLASLLLLGCSSSPQAESVVPTFGQSRVFAGKLEGNWEYVAFRECGTPENCFNSVSDCGVEVSEAAKGDWARLLPNPEDSYWIVFVGRKRAASLAEFADNLDSQECVVEVQRLQTACESSSPIYPDQDGQRPACASAATPAMSPQAEAGS